jgi:hypothetical protein
MFPSRVNPASGKSCRNSEGFDGMLTPGNTKEKTPDIYNQQYSLVSEKGESIGIYEMGSLAGSSGVAYQTSQRSPLSYNIDLPKSSPMTELTFSKFRRHDGGVMEGGENTKINAREVIHLHNANVSSFYNKPVSSDSGRTGGGGRTGSHTDGEEQSRLSYYDELIQQLSKILETRGSGSGEDLSDISGDTLSQVYHYGITAVLLYLLYRILYVKRK